MQISRQSTVEEFDAISRIARIVGRIKEQFLVPSVVILNPDWASINFKAFLPDPLVEILGLPVVYSESVKSFSVGVEERQ